MSSLLYGMQHKRVVDETPAIMVGGLRQKQLAIVSVLRVQRVVVEQQQLL